jgi:hypothetical protein
VTQFFDANLTKIREARAQKRVSFLYIFDTTKTKKAQQFVQKAKS